jgi:nitroreductase
MNIEDVIHARRTLKLRADPENPLDITKGEAFKRTVEELLELAGKAPFHYESPQELRQRDLDGAEPWRFHALDALSCRKLLADFNKNKPVKSSEGIKQMLATADALILVTWLPEHSNKKQGKFHPNVKNMEHIAATGAAIQNLLLAATGMGIINYWSSGGSLRTAKVKRHVGIPEEEILLGAIFLFPSEYPDSVLLKKGKNRENRGPLTDWMNWLELD